MAGPVWREVYEQCAARAGSMSYGEPFWTLKDICERFGVSSITARRVVSELRNAGLVKPIPRRGTIVTRLERRVGVRLLLHGSLAIPDIRKHPHIARLQHGIEEEAARLDVRFDVCSETTLPVISHTDGGQSLGFLVLQRLGQQCLAFLRWRKLPFVYVHAADAERGVSAVNVDMRHGAYVATTHLLDQGHRRIAFLTASLASPYQRPRFVGYRTALRERGVRLDWGLVHEVREDNGLDGSEAIAELLDLAKPPTALFASNDYTALHALLYCRRRGLRVPGDLSIIGYDNIAESAMSSPPLTTVDSRLAKVGAEALHVLLEQMTGKGPATPRTKVIRPGLIERGSTGPPLGERV